jgi:mRNA interferase RelE/StbE
MRSLANDPRPPGWEKLAGVESLYRIRVRNYRIVYQIQDVALVVLVVKIGHRREVYR